MWSAPIPAASLRGSFLRARHAPSYFARGLVINAESARVPGLTVPPLMLTIADDLIE